ncbi:MAG TPA: branched-chain amino acid ABC transporter substrate-binding protein [Burkholderiales bacterium]|nr:branched-chain amino acid ABC transporter substrate-binding protein [Burkholderiales bacterium]
MRITKTLRALLVVAACTCASLCAAQEPIKIALLEPLSGPFGLVGESISRHMQAAVDEVNEHGGVLGGTKLELMRMDDKLSPQEGVLLLKHAIDEKVRIVTLASGSNIAHALIESIAKHNARNPSESVLFLNFGAMDPALTNEKCNFWHFRFEPNTDMKLNALTAYMAHQRKIHEVYLLNEDFAYGQAISRGAKEQLAQRRPDVKIVGDDLHPLLKVKDFSPYVAKVKASGADSLVTGNGGPDIYLLVKAGKDAGLDINYYTLNAHTIGVAAAIGGAGADRINQVLAWHSNVSPNKLEETAARYKKRFNEDYWYYTAKVEVDMLVKAINQAQSADSLKIAKALEGLRMQGDTGELWMRAEDHQLVQPLYVATYRKVTPPAHDVEGIGYGWQTDTRMEGNDTAVPTTCKMERPE